MPKANIQEILQEKRKLKELIEHDWQSFLKKDIYLIFEEKRKFFK